MIEPGQIHFARAAGELVWIEVKSSLHGPQPTISSCEPFHIQTEDRP